MVHKSNIVLQLARNISPALMATVLALPGLFNLFPGETPANDVAKPFILAPTPTKLEPTRTIISPDSWQPNTGLAQVGFLSLVNLALGCGLLFMAGSVILSKALDNIEMTSDELFDSSTTLNDNSENLGKGDDEYDSDDDLPTDEDSDEDEDADKFVPPYEAPPPPPPPPSDGSGVEDAPWPRWLWWIFALICLSIMLFFGRHLLCNAIRSVITPRATDWSEELAEKVTEIANDAEQFNIRRIRNLEIQREYLQAALSRQIAYGRMRDSCLVGASVVIIGAGLALGWMKIGSDKLKKQAANHEELRKLLEEIHTKDLEYEKAQSQRLKNKIREIAWYGLKYEEKLLRQQILLEQAYMDISVDARHYKFIVKEIMAGKFSSARTHYNQGPWGESFDMDADYEQASDALSVIC